MVSLWDTFACPVVSSAEVGQHFTELSCQPSIPLTIIRLELEVQDPYLPAKSPFRMPMMAET
jgi:hypothetical protein